MRYRIIGVLSNPVEELPAWVGRGDAEKIFRLATELHPYSTVKLQRLDPTPADGLPQWETIAGEEAEAD